jgi:biopolymer transport protein ExbD
MANKKPSTPVTLKRPSRKVSAPSDSKPVALTLKVDQQTYVRLCTLGATERRTNQDILNEALQEHLKRFGA